MTTIARRGARALLLLLLISIASLLVAATTAASPIEGAEKQTGTAPTHITFFSAPASCPAFPALSGPTPELQYTTAGWYGPVDNGVFEVQLTARVTGAATDRSGNVYRVHGHFAEHGERNVFLDFGLFFRGEGTLTITGPAGTYSGRARAVVLGGPPETQLAFTEMAACRTS
jgi:autotransporter-associated beta strand protein